MKNILVALVLCWGIHANADWVEDSVVHEVTSKDAMEMAEALVLFPEALDWLNAHNLTGASRLKVVGLAGAISLYRWENDAVCTVPDPTAIPKIELYTSTADYLYEAEPTVVWQLLTVIHSADPCSGGPRPQASHIFRRRL